VLRSSVPGGTGNEAALELADRIRERIRRQYLDGDSRPWVVSYSGGKDSTLLAHLTFEAVVSVRPSRRSRPVYVVCSDTRVETPEIADHIRRSIDQMNHSASARRLPISAHLVTPPIADTFWVRIIGHGYPPPSRLFRWCTDRMKIKPSNSFIREHVNRDGRVLLLMGARADESQTRARSLQRHSIADEFQSHRRLPAALVWAPLQGLTTEDVWRVLVFTPSAWGGDHVALRDLYKDAHAGECFLVTQEGTDPCGNSRFGCWTCTVVERDRSLEGLIANGREAYRGLSDLRDYLIELRDSGHTYREDRRKNGEEGIGPLKQSVRGDLLDRVLALQVDTGIDLIGADEVNAIRLIWISDRLDRPRSEQSPTPTVHAGVL
jgi:DNA sulfur modification protein DndC